jgi:type IV secretion system protein VirB6
MGVATQVEGAIDLLLNNFVTSKSAALSSALVPIALTAVTIYVLMMGYAIMRGESNDALHTFLWKSFKIAFISGIALSAGEFQGTIIQFVQGIQEGMTQAMGGVTSIGQLVDNMATPYYDLGQKLLSEATVDMWPNLSLLAAAGLVAIAQACLFVVGLGLYLLSKVALALVLAVGPAFILCAMFPPTQKYTESWIGQALNFALLSVLVAASIAMLTDFASQYANSIKENMETTNVVRDALALLLASGALTVVMLNLPQLASALSGGVSVAGIGREIGRAMLGARRPSGSTAAHRGGEIKNTSNSNLPMQAGTGGKPFYQRQVIDNLYRSS